jgi:hypothetical protein
MESESCEIMMEETEEDGEIQEPTASAAVSHCFLCSLHRQEIKPSKLYRVLILLYTEALNVKET